MGIIIDTLKQWRLIRNLKKKDQKSFKSEEADFAISSPALLSSISITLTLLLGKIFYKFEPILGLVQASLVFLLSFVYFFYATKIYRVGGSSSSSEYYYQFNFYLDIFLTCLILIPTSLVTAFYSQKISWFIVGIIFITFLFILFSVWKKSSLSDYYSEFISEIKSENKKGVPKRNYYKFSKSIGFGFLSIGIIYLIIFISATIINFDNYHDILNDILLKNLSVNSKNTDFLTALKTISFNATKPNNLFSLGILVGSSHIVIGLLFLLGVKDGLYKTIILVLGQFFGYSLTIYFYYLFTSSLSGNLLFLSTFQLSYIFLILLLFKSLLSLPKWGIEDKYANFFDAIHSIMTAWLLSKILGTSSEVFSGITFFVSVFVATCIIEYLTKRIKFDVITKYLDHYVSPPSKNRGIFNTNDLNKKVIRNTMIIGCIYPLIILTVLYIFSLTL